jgi:pyridoxal 5'-phosphate synthase pdxS subunit
MIRTKGEAGTGDVVEAVAHMRKIMYEIGKCTVAKWEELATVAKEIQAPLDLVQECHKTGRLPVPNFSAGGIATPADAALMMKLGAESVFVGSGIFKSGDPARRAKAIVEAVLFHKDPKKLAEISRNLGEPMVGINVSSLDEKDLLATRGW